MTGNLVYTFLYEHFREKLLLHTLYDGWCQKLLAIRLSITYCRPRFYIPERPCIVYHEKYLVFHALSFYGTEADAG